MNGPASGHYPAKQASSIGQKVDHMVRSWSIATVHGLDQLLPSWTPLKYNPTAGTAVSVTVEPVAKAAPQPPDDEEQ